MRAGQREVLRKADRDQHLERGGFFRWRDGVEARGDLDVGEMDGGRGVEADRAVQAAEPPHVLILDEGGVGVLDDDGDELVLDARADERGDVKLGRQARVLGKADRDAVDVNGEHAVGAAEVQHHARALPRGGDAEGAAINAGGVFLRREGRLLREGHAHVGVVRATMPVHLPVRRHGDGAPRGGIVERTTLGEGLRVLGRTLEAELPLAVERLEPRGLFAHAGEGLARRRVNVERGARGQFVERGELGGFPGFDETGEEHGGRKNG